MSAIHGAETDHLENPAVMPETAAVVADSERGTPAAPSSGIAGCRRAAERLLHEAVPVLRPSAASRPEALPAVRSVPSGGSAGCASRAGARCALRPSFSKKIGGTPSGIPGIIPKFAG